MSTWGDQNSAAISNWISKLSPVADENLCIASIPAHPPPPRSIPSLANSASSPESKEISVESRKRKQFDSGQDHFARVQKRAYLPNKQEEYFCIRQSDAASEMDDDRASVAGSTPSLISNRPILEAKSPSRRASRSTSPIRSTLALLRSAVPPIDICQPGPAAAANPGEAVNKLKAFLLDGYDKAFIPIQLEVSLSAFCLTPISSMLTIHTNRHNYAKLLQMKLLPCTEQCSMTITDIQLKSLTPCGEVSRRYIMRLMHAATF
jgi:hypothetical protein